MKKLLLALLACYSVATNAVSLPKELVPEFKGLNIANIQNDVTLDDGLLWIRMNYDAPIPEIMGNSVIFNDVCMSMKYTPKLWKKYDIKKIKVTTLVEWKAYIFNGGLKECIEYWTKEGASEKYKKAPYFEEWIRK